MKMGMTLRGEKKALGIREDIERRVSPAGLTRRGELEPPAASPGLWDCHPRALLGKTLETLIHLMRGVWEHVASFAESTLLLSATRAEPTRRGDGLGSSPGIHLLVRVGLFRTKNGRALNLVAREYPCRCSVMSAHLRGRRA